MRVLVCGGRDYTDYERAEDVFTDTDITHVVQGGAPGADALARRWCRENNVPCVTVEADWTTHGRSAGPLRNQRMLDEHEIDQVIAFPGGRGTEDMVLRAMRKRLNIWVVAP